MQLGPYHWIRSKVSTQILTQIHRYLLSQPSQINKEAELGGTVQKPQLLRELKQEDHLRPGVPGSLVNMVRPCLQTENQTKHLCYLQDTVGNMEKCKPALKEFVIWLKKQALKRQTVKQRFLI